MIAAPKSIAGPNLFQLFVNELGNERVCELLEVHEKTLRRWLRGTTPVPRMAVLALFWETRYGLSLIDTDQVNEIRLLYRRVKILEDQFARAKEIVAGLRRLHAGTANEPLFEELPKTFEFDSVPMPYGLTVRTVGAKEAMG